MRILSLIPWDVYQEPGARTARSLGLAAELRRQGAEVRLVYLLAPDTIPLEAARSRQEHPFETLPVAAWRLGEITRLARRSDVIWFQSALPGIASIALAAGYMTGKPVHADWDEWEGAASDPAATRRATRWPVAVAEWGVPRLADSLSVASAALHGLACASGVREDRVVLAPAGVNLHQFSPAADGSAPRRELKLAGPVIHFLGQSELTEDFLRMVLAMQTKDQFVTALLAGEAGGLAPLAAKFTGDRRVVFAGPVERFGLPALMAAGTIAVALYRDTPADRARAPLAVVQAMAMGKPLVATAVGEVPGVLGDGGYQPQPGDFAGHVRALEELHADPARARELGARARVYAQQRGHWGNSAAQILELLGRVLEERSIRTFLPGPPAEGASDGPSLPPELANDPMQRASRLVKENLDLVGILDGRTSFTGPRMVQLDLTNACNNDCIACWSFSPLLADKAMPHEERALSIPPARALELVDELASLGTQEIYLAGGGDPGMYPQLLDVIARIKERGMAATLHTNFSLFDRARAQRLVELGLDRLTVSLWAASAATYARSHPNKAEETFERVVSTLGHLTAVRGARLAPFVKLYNVISKLNVREFPAMYDFARGLSADAIEFAPVDTIPGRTDSLLLDEEERRWLEDRSQEMQAASEASGGRPQLFDFDVFVNRISSRATVSGLHDEANLAVLPCTIGFHFARIMADGNVTPCMKGDRIPLGNVLEKSFRQIWAGERHLWFRDKARQIPRSDPFFSLIGKDPAARVGCHKSCDDIGRNKDAQRRLASLTWTERFLLYAAGPVLKATGRAV